MKFSYKHGEGLDFTAGLSQKDGFERLSQLTADQCLVPEELSTFISSLNSTETTPV